jgi:hypothetical protein
MNFADRQAAPPGPLGRASDEVTFVYGGACGFGAAVCFGTAGGKADQGLVITLALTPGTKPDIAGADQIRPIASTMACQSVCAFPFGFP